MGVLKNKHEENKLTTAELGFTLNKDFVLIPCCFYLNFYCFGFPASLGVLYAELINQFDTQHAEIAMIQSLAIGLLGLAVLWNYPVNKYGLLRCALVNSVACPLSIIISSFSSSIHMMIVFLGVLNGLTSAILNSVSYFVMNKYISSERSKLITFVSVGGASGQLIFSLLLESLIQVYGWRGAVLVCGGMGLQMIPCTVLLYLRTRCCLNHHTDGNVDKLWKPYLLRNWKFIVVLINAFFFAFSAFTATKFLVDYSVKKGYSRATGSLFVSVIGIANVVGRAACVLIQICLPERSFILLAIFACLSGCSQFIITLTNTFWVLISASVINGLGLGLCTSQLSVCVLEIYPMEHYSFGLSMILCWFGIGNIAGGYAGGLLEDATGSYAAIFIIGFILALCSSVAYLIVHIDIGRKRKNFGYIEM